MEGPRTRNWSRGSALLAAGLLATAMALPVAAQDSEGVATIGYVSPEPATDYGWNEQGLVGAQAAADSVGATLIKQDGVGYGPEEVGPILNQLAEEDVDFIVAQGSAYNEVAPVFAAENDIPVVVYDNPDAMAAGLVANIGTDGHEGGYLAGVLAGTMTTTGELGIVLSAANDVNWLKQAGGFVQGARAVNPDVTFHVGVIDEFGYADAAGGNRVTTQVISQGADIIFGMGDGSSFGMLEAVANNVPEGAEQAWFIDVIGDKTSIDEAGVLLSSVLWDFSSTLTEAVAAIDDGTFGTVNYVLNVPNGGLDLLDTQYISDDARAAVDEARQGLIDGSVTVQPTATREELDALIG